MPALRFPALNQRYIENHGPAFYCTRTRAVSAAAFLLDLVLRANFSDLARIRVRRNYQLGTHVRFTVTAGFILHRLTPVARPEMSTEFQGDALCSDRVCALRPKWIRRRVGANWEGLRLVFFFSSIWVWVTRLSQSESARRLQVGRS